MIDQTGIPSRLSAALIAASECVYTFIFGTAWRRPAAALAPLDLHQAHAAVAAIDSFLCSRKCGT